MENAFMTTIERKKMSTKTTFKRIALAVVAVMGLGVLAAGPSSAAVSSLTVTSTAGTATTVASDSSTAAVLAISYVQSEAQDSVVVSSFVASKPTAAPADSSTGQLVRQVLQDTATSTKVVDVDALNESGTLAAVAFGGDGVVLDSALVVTAGANVGNVGLKVRIFLDTTTARASGTYVITSIVTPYNNGIAGTPVTANSSIVVAATAGELATASTVIDPSKTVAILAAGSTGNPSTDVNIVDSSLAFIATAAATEHASFVVKTFNAQGVARPESVTATITGAGVLQSGGAVGNAITVTGASGESTFTVRANGIAGVGSIVISTPTKTFAPKLVTFYAKDPATIVPAVEVPVIATGAAVDDVIALDAKDANGNIWAGTAYLISTDTAVATGSTCEYDATDEVHYCAVTGVAAGQSKFRVGNASTLALSTVAIAEFDGPRVSIQTPASVKIEFDKATYQPGEKAKVYITVLDAAGNTLPANTYSNVFTSTGIAVNLAFATGGESLTATSITTAASTSALTLTKAGSAMYSMTMGTASGTVELTAKGGTGLPLAGQVAVTASADVINTAEDAANEALDAAIAATDAAILAEEAAANAEAAATAAAETAEAALDAVTALSAQVTKLVARLASLQKLVNKIAKRVGA
jgi:hypothetical protein